MAGENESTAPHNEILKGILHKTGIPFKYRNFKGDEEVPLPFIVYYFEREQFSGSDERNRIVEVNAVIEFYTDSKDFETEQKIEEELSANELLKTEDFFYANEVFQITYEFAIKIKIRR